MDDYPYNDDLLSEPDDLEHARTTYPSIAFALHFPRLLELFGEADTAAGAAKRKVRRRGMASVGLVLAALIAASAAPLYHQYHPWSNLIVLVAAVMGIVGGLIGLGLFTARHKEQWLQNRLVTESLRQFHFRTLIALAPEILAAAASGDPLDFDANPTPEFKAFDQKRRAALEELVPNLIRRKPEEFTVIVKHDSNRLAPRIHPMPDAKVFDSPHGEALFAAYCNFRIRRQRQYADHKLMKKGGLFSPFPKKQAVVLSATGIACVFLLLGLHIVSAMASVSERGQELIKVLDFIAIWTALIALALRAIEEGLKPHAEVERYRHYSATSERILDLFDAADNAGKVAAASALERAAYDEMAIFLRAHHESRFSI